MLRSPCQFVYSVSTCKYTDKVSNTLLKHGRECINVILLEMKFWYNILTFLGKGLKVIAIDSSIKYQIRVRRVEAMYMQDKVTPGTFFVTL